MTVTHELTSAGYADLYVEPAPGASTRPAIEWIRSILEDAPLAVRAGLPPGWALLGLGLSPRHSPDHVLGWPVVVDTPGEVVLGTRSRLGFDARLGVTTDAGTVRFTTAIVFHGRGSRRLWAAVAPLHRVTVSRLLRRAARSPARPAA